MHHHSRKGHVVPVVLLGLIAGLFVGLGCGSIAFKADFDEQANFRDYTTFHVLRPAIPPAGDRASDLVLQRRLEMALESELLTRGLRSDSKKQADLLVAYHLGIHDTVNVGAWGYHYGPSWQKDDQRKFGPSTLVIDLVDRNTMEVVWRGWAKGIVGNHDQTQQRISHAVISILDKYPPRG